MEKKLIILPYMQPEVVAKSHVRLQGRFLLKDSHFSYSAKRYHIASDSAALATAPPRSSDSSDITIPGDQLNRMGTSHPQRSAEPQGYTGPRESVQQHGSTTLRMYEVFEKSTLTGCILSRLRVYYRYVISSPEVKTAQPSKINGLRFLGVWRI